MNKLNPEIKYTCSSCGRENSYVLDTPKMLRSFAKTYKPDETIEVESGSRKFTFVVGWPKVLAVEDFFKNYYKKYDNSGKAIKESMDNLSQVEYITMFIKGHSINLFCQNAQIPNFWLKNNRLPPMADVTVISLYINSNYGKKPSRIM